MRPRRARPTGRRRGSLPVQRPNRLGGGWRRTAEKGRFPYLAPVPPPAGKRSVSGVRAKGAARHAVALAFGTVVAGVAAYGYVALGTRHYGADAFAPVAVLWSVWPMAAA